MPRSNSRSTIYRREIVDVCLNCPYPKCQDAAAGCQIFKDKWKQATNKSNRKGWLPKRKEA